MTSQGLEKTTYKEAVVASLKITYSKQMRTNNFRLGRGGEGADPGACITCKFDFKNSRLLYLRLESITYFPMTDY